MPYKPGILRPDKSAILPYRDPLFVDKVVGKIRKAVQVGTGFWEWPLWKAHPTWAQYNEQLAQERVDAEKEGREPHRAVAPPPPGLHGNDKSSMDYGPERTHTPHRGLPAKPFKY